MSRSSPNVQYLKAVIQKGVQLPWATKNYPSRGQTAIQNLYQTSEGKFFLKKVSKQNHIDCQIKVASGTLAEREFWAYRLASHLGLNVPNLWLLDEYTTIQKWRDFPDARQFATSQGKMDLKADNVFDCALFDWMSGQVDRHDANYLYDYVDQEIILIDSAHAFLKYTGSIPDYLRYFEIGFPKELKISRSTGVLTKVLALSKKTLKKIVPLRNIEESSSLTNRLLQLKNVHCLQDIISLYRGGYQ